MHDEDSQFQGTPPGPFDAEPSAAEGESIAWMADSETHLSDLERQASEPPGYQVVSGPLPVCEYTGEPTDEPCEEPATVKRWSGAAVVTAAAIGSIVGALLATAGVVWALGQWPGARPVDKTDTVATKPADIEINPSDNVDTAVAVATKVTPSVVYVAIEQRSFNPYTGETELVETGNGSGVVIRGDGYILTNNHVIADAERIMVTLGVDDVEAEVVGTDPTTDLAVLKIPGVGHPAIDVGASAALEVGEFVVAVGSPFGLEKTVTSGIVSALQRTSLVEDSTNITAYTNLIQTDAAINPGNSGGALVNAKGELIGINTLIQSSSASVGAPQSAGIGFAIPVDFAMSVASQLIETGTAVHPYMGVRSTNIDEAIAAQFNLPVERGALVQFVEPGSPAEKAGLERGDIITSISGRDIATPEDMFAAIREHSIGDTVRVVVIRSDAQRTFDLVLGSDARTP